MESDNKEQNKTSKVKSQTLEPKEVRAMIRKALKEAQRPEKLVIPKKTSDWEPKYKSKPESIDYFKNNWHGPQTVTDKLALLDSILKNGNKNLPDFGKDFDILESKYEADPKSLDPQLDYIRRTLEPYTGVRDSEIGLSYADRTSDKKSANEAITIYDSLKLGKGDFDEGFKILRTLIHNKALDMTSKRLKELIALDDFGTIFNAIKKVAPKIGTFLVTAAKDYGLPLVKQMISNITNEQQEVAHEIKEVPKVDNIRNSNKEAFDNLGSRVVSVKSKTNYRTTMETVARNYFCSVLCPEKYAARLVAGIRPVKTALVSGSVTFNLTTDINGNTACYVVPFNAFGSGNLQNNTQVSQFALYNPPNFIPSSGAYTANITGLAGPLLSIATNIQSYRITSFSLRATPITSVNNSQGNFQLAMFTDLNLSSLQSAMPSIPQGAYSLNPFYQSGNCLTTYRSVYPFNGVYDLVTVGLAQNNTGPDTSVISVLVTGGVPNTQVIKIDCAYTYEITPSPSSASLSFADFAEVGPATIDCLTTAFTLVPGVQMLTLDKALELTSLIQNATDTDYGSIVDIVTSFTNKHHKSRDMPIFSSASNQDNEMSLDAYD